MNWLYKNSEWINVAGYVLLAIGLVMLGHGII